MKQMPTVNVHLILFSIFFLMISNQLHASGAKRPDTSGWPSKINEDNSKETQEKREEYSYLDPENIVPKKLLKKSLDFFIKNQMIITNKQYMVVIDYKQHNSIKRFHVINMETGFVESYLTAHGKNSDPAHTGYATRFSNRTDSMMTSLGFFLTRETYHGERGFSLKLDGLSSTNSNARSRGVVIHGAEYVFPADKIGRSYGCPALELRYYREIIEKIKEGALVFAD